MNLIPRHSIPALRSLMILLLGLSLIPVDVEGAGRSRAGLVLLYDFEENGGEVVRDRSGVEPAMDLRIADPKAVRWGGGSMEVVGKTLIRSGDPALKLIDAVRQSGEFTVEAWVRPARVDQSGPARVVTLSKDSGQRNFTLGQEGDHFAIRFRSTRTSENGIPELSSAGGTLPKGLFHVVYTRSRSGLTVLYVDGKRVAEKKLEGTPESWSRSYEFALANELTSDRPWLGAYHLVAVYNRDLLAREVEEHFKAGEGGATVAPVAEGSPGLLRVVEGLQVLYDFGSATGALVKDRSGVGEPLDLKIADLGGVRRAAGSLEVRGETLISSDKPATKLNEAVRRSGELTVEAWVRPARQDQSGPARIVTSSRNPNERNFTLGQDGGRYEVRLRTSRTSVNGIPPVLSAERSLSTALTHVVYTRDRAGRALIYLDGKPGREEKVEGTAGNWDTSMSLALANEPGGGRPWLGTYHLVAIYNRSLTPQEVQQNFRAGAGASGEGLLALGRTRKSEQFFETEVAPLLARHCLECHDASTAKGKLDLSRKETALAGGKEGRVIVPGKPSESPLWEAVEAGEMPDERPPLSAAEKQVLKEWIADGAAWSLERIDPAVYVHDNRSARNWVRRLTLSEYIATVKATLGVDIAKEANEILPRDSRADGFGNTAYNLTIDLKHVEAYARMAALIVDRMDVGKFARAYTKDRRPVDDNMRPMIEKMGRWVLRGPMEGHEIDLYRGISTTLSSAGGEFEDGVGLILEAMLQSPRFIYRMESQLGDGTAWPVNEYELASRMSYIIWGASPDRGLADAAASGALLDPPKLDAELDRMLADPRTVERSLQFVSEWLNLGRLDHLRPSAERFPGWVAELGPEMREETLAFFEEVVWKQDRPLSDLLNAQFTYATPRLAAHYGLKPAGEGLQRYDLASVPGRGGLLTQGSVLTVGGDEASMVARGLFVMRGLLRGVVKDPPPCVDTRPVPTRAGLTQRGVAEARIADRSCGGCHSKFEPLAFGLEKFDGLGAYHEKDEHGNVLREDGEVLVPGEAKPAGYRTSAELMDLMAGSERVRQSLTWKLTQFALGRPLAAEDARVVDKIHAVAQREGGRYGDLLRAIVKSELVLTTRTERRQ